MGEADQEDEELAARFARGDASAVRSLYERHGSAVLRYAIALTGSRQTAEDVVHDAFVELMRAPRLFDPTRGSFAAFLFGIARHRLYRILRGSVRTQSLGDLDDGAAKGTDGLALQLPPVASSEDEASRAQLVEQVRSAILELPLAHREVVALCDLEELPYERVAAILGCPIGTVRSRLHRARALLLIRLAAIGAFDAPASRAASARDTDGSGVNHLSLDCSRTPS